MATIDSQVLRAMSAISSWAKCINTNDRAINLVATPINDTANAHAFLDIAIFFVRRTSLLSAGFLPVEI